MTPTASRIRTRHKPPPADITSITDGSRRSSPGSAPHQSAFEARSRPSRSSVAADSLDSATKRSCDSTRSSEVGKGRPELRRLELRQHIGLIEEVLLDER